MVMPNTWRNWKSSDAVAHGLDVVIVNPALVFGSGDVYRQNKSLVMQIAKQRLPVIVNGGVNVVHIDDVIDGHLAALERGQTGQRYILGGENLSIGEMVKMIGTVVGKPAPGVVAPAGLVRAAARPMRLLEPFLALPFEMSIYASQIAISIMICVNRSLNWVWPHCARR
jgi:dihydroflavonol-4-reductase